MKILKKEVIIIFILLFSLFLPLSPGLVVADDWVINGSVVSFEDENVYLSADPYMASSPQWVEFELETVSFSGPIDTVWGFDIPNIKPSKPQLYAPYYENWTTQHSHLFEDVVSFTTSEEPCDFGNDYNLYRYNVTYHVCSEWNESSFECESYNETTAVVGFDSYEWNGSDCTVFWSTKHSKYIEWIDTPLNRFGVWHHDYDGMNIWYYLKDVNVEAGTRYKMRVWLDVPISTEEISGKYYWAAKPSSETLQEAIANGHFYCLDPWYNAQWSHRKTITVTNPTDETLTNFPVLINVSYEAEMQNDFEDVVFTDLSSVIRPFEQDYYADSSYALYWCNVSSIPASSFTTIYMYSGNDAAVSQEDPENTWDSNYVMVQHMSDYNSTTIHDSTQYANHGTKFAPNEPLEVSGGVGKAQEFDGVDDFINCGNDNSLELSQSFTIELCMKFGAILSDMPVTFIVIRKDGGYTSTRNYAFYRYNNQTTMYFNAQKVTQDGYAFNIPLSNANNYFDDLDPHLVTLLWDRDITTAKIYIDGASKATSMGSDVDIYTGSEIMYISYFKINYPYEGTISEVRVSDVARSAAWIGATNEFVVNQSTYVTWGGGEGPCPCEPSVSYTTGNFWVNFTFTPDDTGCPLTTDGYNVSWNNGTDSGWINGTDAWANISADPHTWVNITVWSWNSTEAVLSCDNVTASVQIPNNAPVISGCEDVLYGSTGFNVTLDLNYTDVDGDTCSFSTDFPYGTLNMTTGVFAWGIPAELPGVYYVNFTVNDSYGGSDWCNITIGNLDMLIYLQNLELVEEQEMLADMWLYLILALVSIVLFFISFFVRRGDYYVHIIMSIFSMLLAFLLALYSPTEEIAHPELSYIFVFLGMIALLATAIYIAEAVQDVWPVTAKAKAKAEEKERQKEEERYWNMDW